MTQEKAPLPDGAGKQGGIGYEHWSSESSLTAPRKQESRRPINLSAEMDAASDHCPPRRIMDAGLDWEACMEAGGIVLVRAETFNGGFYEPSPTGRWLWCLPCFYGAVRAETLADLVAWAPDDPGRWWRRVAHAGVLGHTAVQRARASVFDFGLADDDPAPEPPTLVLHPTPKDYALAGFSGAVVLDWQHGVGELDGVARLVCPNLDFAERVNQQINRRRMPAPAVLVTHREAA